MSHLDQVVSKAIQELERIENTGGAINLYEANSTEDNKLGITDDFASEIASEIANKMEENTRKKLLRITIITLLKEGHSLDMILSINGILDHFTMDEIMMLKKKVQKSL